MPRRNIALLLFIAALSLACYLKVNYYGRILVFAMGEIQQRALVEVDQRDLFEGALDGMTRRLDVHSMYIPPKQLAKFEESLDQEFGGVGIRIMLDRHTKQLTVVTPLYDTPAQKAGILAGDKILAIDGVSTHGLSIQEASNRMRGKPEEPVVLTIQHPGQQQPIDVTIVRAIIPVDSVLGDRRDADGHWDYFLEGHDGIGYLRIENFGEKTVDELKRALDTLTKAGMRGLILDLRNDPGGLLSAAVGTCDLLIDSGVIVTTRDRSKEVKRKYEATGPGTYGGFPVAVLVNQRSASASEIVAACLQDHHRAVIVGQRTFGKGTVQEVILLEGGLGALKLTTSSYWRPSGKDINRPIRRNANRARGPAEEEDDDDQAAEEDDWGVRPDKGYELVLDEPQRLRLEYWRIRRDANQKLEPGHSPEELDPTDLAADPQLAKALEYVQRAAGSGPSSPK